MNSDPPLRIALSGARGLVGTALGALLARGGHQVIPLVRGAPGGRGLAWDPVRGVLEPERLEGLDAVVHLAGENIAARRWSRAQMARIRDSRVGGTRALVASLRGLSAPPRAFLCASAIGYYGDRGEAVLDEDSPPGEGFLAATCQAWEAQARAAEELGCRVCLLRFGIVLSTAGGALARMLTPFRLGLGGRVGSGRQVMSWIAIDDAAAAIEHALVRPELDGPLNLTAPEALSNREWTRTLARVLRRPALVPLPAFAARCLLGRRMAGELLLSGARVLPRALQASGFTFRHARLEPALRYLLGRGPGE